MGDQQLERLQIMLTADEMAALDDWRYSNRVPTRAAAVRELLKRGLTAARDAIDHKAKRSRDFRVVEPRTNGGAND